jgi:hypothetical protein
VWPLDKTPHLGVVIKLLRILHNYSLCPFMNVVLDSDEVQRRFSECGEGGVQVHRSSCERGHLNAVLKRQRKGDRGSTSL